MRVEKKRAGRRLNGTRALFTRLAALGVIAFGVMGQVACGMSEEAAREWCEQFRENDPFGATCITDEAFEQCVACHMDCGKCRQIKTCPQTFECYE